MGIRPRIFISAVSKELASARQLVANTLQMLGYEPVWQDVFGTEEGDVREMLRRQIDSCQGVVQLIGQSYGVEPPAPDEQFGRVSYTQYEALYAKSRSKKVWYLILDGQFPSDAHAPESAELAALQDQYRQTLRADPHLFHALANRDALESRVLKMRDDLARLRRGVKRWAAMATVLLLVCVGIGLWSLKSQHRSSEQVEANTQEVAKLRQAVLDFASEQSKTRHSDKDDPAALEQRTYAALAQKLGVDEKVLREKLPQFADELRRSPQTSTYDRANAVFVEKDYAESERLAMQAAHEANTASPPQTADAIKALKLAGQAAQSRIAYSDSLQHFKQAEALTDQHRDPLEWARVQFALAQVLRDMGAPADAEARLRPAMEVTSKQLGPDDPETIAFHHKIAVALDDEGKYPQAQKEYESVLADRQRVLGPENPDTLSTANSLASLFAEQGRYADAEKQFRAILAIDQRVSGPDNPNTLAVMNNLAIVVENQSKDAEAETIYTQTIAGYKRVFGPEHPSTLTARCNLGNTLRNEKKFAQAEQEFKDVLEIRQRVLGPEHPDTMISRNNLANLLNDQGKYADAEKEYRAVLAVDQRLLGPEHPATLIARSNLALSLDNQTKYADAEKEFRQVLSLRERVLGPEHPETLSTCYSLAQNLQSQQKLDEARTLAQHALDGAIHAFGPNHPDTKAYVDLVASMRK